MQPPNDAAKNTASGFQYSAVKNIATIYKITNTKLVQAAITQYQNALTFSAISPTFRVSGAAPFTSGPQTAPRG